MIHESENKQAIQSKRMITEGLLRLLQTKPYHEITVTDICRQAQIVRQTFYRNFDYRRDVLDYYFETQFQNLMISSPDTGSGEKNMMNLLTSFPVPRETLFLLKKQRIFYILEENMRRIITEKSRESYAFYELLDNPEYRDYQDNVIASTIAVVLSTWVDRGFKESPQELAALLSDILMHAHSLGTENGS